MSQAQDAAAGRRRRQQAQQDLEQRGLAGTVGAEQADAAGLDAGGHAAQGLDVAVPARESLQFNQRHRSICTSARRYSILFSRRVGYAHQNRVLSHARREPFETDLPTNWWAKPTLQEFGYVSERTPWNVETP